MSFPAVQSTNTTAASTQSPSINMPSGLTADDLLLICMRSDAGESPAGSVSGCTKIADFGRSGGGSGTMAIYVKRAAGSDTASYTGALATNRSFHAYRINNWLGVITEVKTATIGTGTSLDPPNLNAGVTDDWLWMVFGSVAGSSGDSVTAAPSNYGNFLGATIQGTVELASARRTLNAQSENPGTFSGTAGTGPMCVTLAVPPPEVFGDIAFEGSGAIAASATNPAVAYPSGISSGDLLALIVGQKPATAGGGGITDPSGWGSPVCAALAQGGYGATLGADTGDTNLWCYTKVATGSESGSLTVTMSDTNVTWGQMHRLSSAVGTAWDVAGATGSDTSAGSVSVTFGSDPGITTEDYVLGAMCIPTDVTTPSQFSAQAFSATGVTFGTVKEVSEPDSTTGNDIGGMTCRARVLSGTSSAAPVMTATAGGTTTNVRGPAAFIRVRRVESGGAPATSNFWPFFL